MHAGILRFFSLFTSLFLIDAQAEDISLPPLALGNTSFMDGVGGPGILFELPLQYYRSNNAMDAQGHSVPGRQRIVTTTVLPHLAYISKDTFLGAYYGTEFLLPLVHLNLDIDNGPSGERSRQGDLIVTPLFLQWSPVSLMGRPYWQRLNFVFSLPTGDYDNNAAINTGSNVWIFNPYYAFTWEATERLEFSGRIQYAWISRNNDPASRLEASNVQSGETIHSNFSVSYALSDSLRIGIAGYQLEQVGADRIDGHRQSDSKERVLGIGPGLMYRRGKDSVFVNFYKESGALNRAEGSQLTLRYLTTF